MIWFFHRKMSVAIKSNSQDDLFHIKNMFYRWFLSMRINVYSHVAAIKLM